MSARLDHAERVVTEKLMGLGCTTPVDPFDPEDCASVAQAAVAALRAAGYELEDVVWMARGSEGGSGAHESGKSSDGKGKGGYLGKHEAPVKPAPAPAKGVGGKK